MLSKRVPKNLINNGKKVGKIVTIIFAVLFAVSIAITLACSAMLPKDKFIKAENGSSYKTMASVDGSLYYATSKGTIDRFDSNGAVLSSLDLSAKAEQMIGDDIGELNYLSFEEDHSYYWAATRQGYLGKISNSNGELSLENVYKFPGKVYAVTETNGKAYVVSGTNGSYLQISVYDVSTDEQLNAGFIYNVQEDRNTMAFTYSKGISSVFALEVVDGKIYLFHKGGIIVMDEALTYNSIGYQISLIEKSEIDKYSEQLRNSNPEWTAAKVKLEAGKLFAAQVKSDFGVQSYEVSSGNIVFANASYDKNKYACYSAEYLGAVYSKADGIFYTLSPNATKLYSFSTSDIAELDVNDAVRGEEVKGITLPDAPCEQYPCVSYDNANNIMLVTHKTAKTISCIDLTSKTLKYSVTADFFITDYFLDGTGENICYLYYDKTLASVGVLILRVINVKEMLIAPVASTLLFAFAVIGIISMIVLVISLLCLIKKGFADKVSEVGKGIVKNKFVYVAMLVSLVLLCMFCYYPAIGSIYISFFDYTADSPLLVWNNFANYVEIFTNAKAMESFMNMFLFLFFDLVCAIVPPLIFAYFLTLMKSKKLSRVLRTLLFIPAVVPSVAGTLIWKTAIYSNDGVINTIIRLCNGTPIDFISSTDFAKWGLILMGFPFIGSYLVYYGAMMNIPDSYYEAAELEGITIWKRFFKIDIPLIMPQIKYVFIMTFIASVQNFSRVYMITNGLWGTSTPVFQMYSAIKDRSDYGLAGAYAAIIFIFLFFATLINLRVKTKGSEGGD